MNRDNMNRDNHLRYGARLYRPLDDPSMPTVTDFLLDSFDVSYKMTEKRRQGELNVFEGKEKVFGSSSKSISEAMGKLLSSADAASPLFAPVRLAMRPARLSASGGHTILALKPHDRHGYTANLTDRRLVKEGAGLIVEGSGLLEEVRNNKPHVTAGFVPGKVEDSFPPHHAPVLDCAFSELFVQIYSVEDHASRTRTAVYDGPVRHFDGF